MAVPVYLSSSYRYCESALITDVADIITTFRDEVLNHNDPAWTEPSAGLFQSPSDAAGRWFDVLLTRISATNLECRFRDKSGTTIYTGRMQIAAAGRIIRYYTGSHHFHVEAVGSVEHVRGGILDLTPDSQTAHDKQYWCAMSRQANDTALAYSEAGGCVMIDNASASCALRMVGLYAPVGNTPQKSPSGGYIFCASGVDCKPTGDNSTYYYAGRQYQLLLCDRDLTPGAEFVVPIDSGAYGTFKVLSLQVSNSRFQAAMRIA
jgi:hypothetical protein